MNETIVEEIRSTAASLDVAKEEIKNLIKDLEDPQGNKIAFDRPVGSGDYTLDEIFAGLSSLFALMSSIDVKENAPFVPKTLLTELNKKIIDIKNCLDACRNIVTNVSNNGGVKSIDAPNLNVVAKNDSAHSLAKHLRNLFNNLDAAYAAWYQVRFVLQTPRLAEFSKYVSEFESSRDQVTAAVNSVVNFRQNAEQRFADIEGLHERAQSSLNELQRTGLEGQTERKTIAEYAAEATNRVAEVKAAEERATALSVSVANYQAQFEAFDKDLAARNKRFEDQNTEYVAIRERLLAQETTAKKLTDDLETLLRGATNVGLASSFSHLQQKMDKELTWARYGFFLSILFLVLLSIPIALYVFPPLQALMKFFGMPIDIVIPKSITDPAKTTDILAQIAARALLLIPGIWLVRFTSARHERLFRLREHYAYKFSIASSVEGFKRQAPDLDQGIAATAFYELTFNPATRMDVNSTEARHPNPAMEWIMKKLGGSNEKAAE